MKHLNTNFFILIIVYNVNSCIFTQYLRQIQLKIDQWHIQK